MVRISYLSLYRLRYLCFIIQSVNVNYICTLAIAGSIYALNSTHLDKEIVGGRVVKKGEVPWIVGLGINRQGKRAFCGGSIISKR